MIFEQPTCFKCVHLNKNERKCTAFRDKIPDEIWLDGGKHKKPLKSQLNKIVFEPILPKVGVFTNQSC